MDIEVFCDESSQEVLADKSANKFLVLGSLWMPAEYREEFKSAIRAIKDEHHYHNEIKWNKVAPSSQAFYQKLVGYFFSTDNLRFRGILVEAEKVDMVRFNHADNELGFYKFYYQLLHHWVLDYNNYSFFLDHKINKDKTRLKELKRVLASANLFANIENVQALPSHESVGIQLADFFMGALNGKMNGKVTSEAKKGLIAEIEHGLGRPIQPTPKAEEKFNVFKINLQGGW